MAHHDLPATVDTVVTAFDRSHVPVLRIDPGDTVVVHSLDAAGHLDPPAAPEPARLEPRRSGPPGHFLTGPIAISGARPGDLLTVGMDALVPGSWGATWSGGRTTPINERIGVVAPPVSRLDWEIGQDAAHTDVEGRRFAVPLAPFLGVVGLAPADPGPHRTVPPRPGSGGNIDCRELVAGSVLHLPVQVPDALLYLGDGHATQGDGEVSGTAVECAMTSTLTVGLIRADDRGDLPDTLHALTPAGRITFGFAGDLDTAAGDALAAMVDWLARRFELPDRTTALAMASVAVDLRVTQVVNEIWGVHAVLAPDRLARVGA